MGLVGVRMVEIRCEEKRLLIIRIRAILKRETTHYGI